MADFLLLHGMSVGAWEWEHVVRALKADPRAGKVIAPDMPGRGPGRPDDLNTVRLREYTATAVAALRDNDLHDTIVVGHSGGGCYLQAAVAAEPQRVRRMVFLCSAVPERGHSLLDLQPQPLRAIVRALLWLNRSGRRGIVPSRRLARRAMCHDIPPSECDDLIRRLVPEPQALLLDRITWPAERVTAPATYILTTQDRVIRPKDQQRMAGNVPNAQIVRFRMGHARPVVEPDQLVSLLLEYAG